MKIKALDIKSGDRIIAYFKNKMQVCTVKRYIASKDKKDITLSVFIGERYRYLSSGTIHFKLEALVDLVN
jgi:paraquat-inducible protein B